MNALAFRLACVAAALVAVAVHAQPTDKLYMPGGSTKIWTGKPSATYVWGSNAANRKNATGVHPGTGAKIERDADGWRRKGDTFITYGDGFSSGVASGDPLPGKIILWTRFQIPGDQSQKSAGDPTNAEYTHNYSPGEGVKPVTVHWFLGPNANGMGAINAGTFYTSGARDWTVKVDADYSKGAVKAQTKLYYGFHATYASKTSFLRELVRVILMTYTGTLAYGGKEYTSTVGHFRAIDAANTFDSLVYAVVSCSNWGFGYFHAYDTLAKIDDLDFYAHAGDNIYEYKDLYYPDAHMKVRTEVTDPPTEIVSLDDYRRRYRMYRDDASLQLLGAHAPLIAIADDHEYTNNAWMTGAENHQPHGNHSSSSSDGAGYDSTPYPEGDYYERMHAAMQAFNEYMPLREVSTAEMDAMKAAVKAGAKVPQNFPGSPAPEVTDALRAVLASQTRSFDFGGLITLMTTEGRIAYRTSSAAVNNDGKLMPPSITAAGTAVATATAPVLSKVVISVLLSPYGEGGPVNWTATDYASIHEAFLTQAYSEDFYNNPAERIMGETTVEKLGKVFADSKAAGIPFQVFLSQTVFQPTTGSDWMGGSAATARPAAQKMAGYAATACNSWWRANCLATKAGIPWNTDSWDGFHNERLKVIEAMSKGNNPIVNSGDAHGYWIAGIKEQGFSGTKAVAAEFAGGSVTSQGWGDYFPTAGGPTFGYTLGPTNNPWLEMLEDGFVAANTRYGEVASFHKHGSLVFHVTNDSYIGNVMTVDTITGTDYHAMCEGAYKVDAKVPGGVTPLQECVVKVSGVVPGKYDGATDKQNGLKLTSSGKPAASGLAGAYFMNAIKTSTTAASGAASTSAVASAALFASVLLALLN